MSRLTAFTGCEVSSITKASRFCVSLKVFTHQIPAVVLPQSGNDAGAGFPQQAEAEAAVNMHPDLFFR